MLNEEEEKVMQCIVIRVLVFALTYLLCYFPFAVDLILYLFNLVFVVKIVSLHLHCVSDFVSIKEYIGLLL
jgi:hypothetical protein